LIALLLFALSLAPAHGSSVLEAEHVRLSDDLEQLANRQLWPAVEKKFAELQKLGVEMTYDDLVHGAYAARAIGNMQQVYDRLRVAARIKGTREVVDWLAAIDANYGLVELVTHNARGGELVFVGELPFDPDQRGAVANAIERVKRDGVFAGLLPRGEYRYAGQPFRVEPGIGVRIEVSPRLKKTTGELVNVSAGPIQPPSPDPTTEP
jgi:hypothetical protein